MIKNVVLGVILPLLLAVSGAVIFASMQRPEPPKNAALGEDIASLMSVMPAAEIQTVHALSEKSETLDIVASGIVVPFREISLAAEVSGRIIEKNAEVRSGNPVRQGDVLLKIDPRDYELEIERLVGKRDQELAAIRELEQDIENTKRLLEVADEEYQLAQDEVERFQALGASFASAAEFDQAKRSRLASMNQRVTLQNQLDSLGTRKQRLELATKLAETELEQARVNLARTVITSPIDGVIVQEQVEIDSYVQRGTGLIRIEDDSKVEVSCSLRMEQMYWILDQIALSSDRLLNAAQAAQQEIPQIDAKIRFRLGDRESIEYEWNGRLDRYDGTGLDPQSRTVPVRIVVDQPRNYTVNGNALTESVHGGLAALVRGMFVEVVLEAKPATQLLLVPKLSIKPASNANRIWQFVADDAALDVVKSRNERRTKSDEALKDPAETKPEAANAQPASEDKRKVAIDPAQWQAGFLRIIEGVHVVSEFQGDQNEDTDQIDYWVCEVPRNSLQPGDTVIVSPLPGIEGTEDEPVRVAKPGMNSKSDEPVGME